MIRDGQLSAIEFRTGEYKNKQYTVAYACYVDDFGGHRDKVLDVEDTYYFVKDRYDSEEKPIKGFEHTNDKGERTQTFFFYGLPISFDRIKNKYKEGQYCIRGIRERS